MEPGTPTAHAVGVFWGLKMSQILPEISFTGKILISKKTPEAFLLWIPKMNSKGNGIGFN
jgi:hypothetical protein